MVIKKHIAPCHLEYQMRLLDQLYLVGLESCTKFSWVVGSELAWKIGNVVRARLGYDPWPGSGARHKLLQALINHLRDQVFCWFTHINNPA